MSIKNIVDNIIKGNLNNIKKIVKENNEVLNMYDNILDCNCLIASVKYYNMYKDDTSIIEYFLSTNKFNIFRTNNNSRNIIDIAYNLRLYTVLKLIYKLLNDEKRLNIINQLINNDNLYTDEQLYKQLKM
jgi:hypothetical protein